MKKLVTVVNPDVPKLIEGVTFLYPLKDFCVGYEFEFEIDEIDGYCLVNRILEDKDCNKLRELIKSSNVKGIMFDDVGVIELLKDIQIDKILLVDHLGTNLISINYYLDYVNSIVVSNDLSEEEIRYIVNNAKKPITVMVFGLKTLMYSRRLLLSNYEEHYHLEKNKNMDASIDDKNFKIVENNYGTKFYAYPYYNALSLLNLKNIYYFWYDPIFLDNEKIKALVSSNNITDIRTDKIFLDKKTIFKVGDIRE